MGRPLALKTRASWNSHINPTKGKWFLLHRRLLFPTATKFIGNTLAMLIRLTASQCERTKWNLALARIALVVLLCSRHALMRTNTNNNNNNNNSK